MYIKREIELCELLDQELSGDTKRINDFFIELFDGLEEYISDKHPDSIFYTKYVNGENIVYMQQDSKNEIMWLSYDHIWSFFKSEFNYKYNDIKELTHSMLEIHMNSEVFPTLVRYYQVLFEVFPTNVQETLSLQAGNTYE